MVSAAASPALLPQPFAFEVLLPSPWATASPAASMAVDDFMAPWLQGVTEAQQHQHPKQRGTATPSTSASSSPREVALPTPCRLPGTSLRFEDPALTSPASVASLGSPGASPWEAPLPPPGLTASPHLVAPPPGLQLPAFRPPPGLPPPAEVGRNAPQRLLSTLPSEDAPSAEWRIMKIFSRLRVSAGFALVSPPLQLGDLSDVRLTFFAGEGWAASARNPKQRKAIGGKQDSSQNGSISVKFGHAGDRQIVKFRLFVGAMPQGPFECNLEERSVHEFNLTIDWRKHLETGSLPLLLQLVSA